MPDIKKVSELDPVTSTSTTDLMHVAVDAGLGSYTSKKITVGNLTSLYETKTVVSGKKIYHGVEARVVGANNPLPTHITSTTFTLGATAHPIAYWFNGVKINVTADKTVTLDDGLSGSTAGLYFVYFDGSTGTILATKDFPGISVGSDVIIATVIWNGTNYGLVGDERHGYNRNADWHVWAHNTVGCRYRSGVTLTHNGGTGAAATFSTTEGEIADEDIQFAVPASSAFPTANAGRLLYQTGASAYAFLAATATTPGYLGAANRPNYVRSDTYALVQMSSAPNRYINVFVYVTSDLHTPVYFFTETVTSTIAGANGYTSVANARAVPFPNLSGFGLSPELKPIYRLIWRADGVLQAINISLDDYRTVSSLPMAAGNTSTTASAVSFNPSGSIVATSVQTAIEELDQDVRALFPVAAQQLTVAASHIAVDASLLGPFYCTLGENAILDAPINGVNGQSIEIDFIQDGTGSRTLDVSAFGIPVDATTPVQPTAASSRSIMAFRLCGASWRITSFLKFSS